MSHNFLNYFFQHEVSKNLGESHRDEESEHRHKSHKDQELDKERKRRHREKKERDRSAVEEKEKHLKERSLLSGEEKSTSRKHKERSPREDRRYRDSSDTGLKEESERKRRDHKVCFKLSLKL